jgi:hypothetical protein
LAGAAALDVDPDDQLMSFVPFAFMVCCSRMRRLLTGEIIGNDLAGWQGRHPIRLEIRSHPERFAMSTDTLLVRYRSLNESDPNAALFGLCRAS